MKGILHIDEFNKLSDEEKRDLLIKWRNNATLKNADIAKAMGLKFYKFQSLCSKYNLPRKSVPKRKHRTLQEIENAKMEVATTSIVPVVKPDIEVYSGTIPEEATELDIRVQGYEVVGVIICNNPEQVSKVREISKLFSHDNLKQVFGYGNLVAVLYKRLEV